MRLFKLSLLIFVYSSYFPCVHNYEQSALKKRSTGANWLTGDYDSPVANEPPPVVEFAGNNHRVLQDSIIPNYGQDPSQHMQQMQHQQFQHQNQFEQVQQRQEHKDPRQHHPQNNHVQNQPGPVNVHVQHQERYQHQQQQQQHQQQHYNQQQGNMNQNAPQRHPIPTPNEAPQMNQESVKQPDTGVNQWLFMGDEPIPEPSAQDERIREEKFASMNNKDDWHAEEIRKQHQALEKGGQAAEGKMGFVPPLSESHIKRPNSHSSDLPLAPLGNNQRVRGEQHRQQNSVGGERQPPRDATFEDTPKGYYKDKIGPNNDFKGFIVEQSYEPPRQNPDRDNRRGDSRKSKSDKEVEQLEKKDHRLDDPPSEIMHGKRWFDDDIESDSSKATLIVISFPWFLCAFITNLALVELLNV